MAPAFGTGAGAYRAQHNLDRVDTRQKLRAIAITQNIGELRMTRLKPGGLTATGEFGVLAPTTADQRMPEFSPDGRQIAFESSRSGMTEMWTARRIRRQSQTNHSFEPHLEIPQVVT